MLKLFSRTEEMKRSMQSLRVEPHIRIINGTLR